jgi:hypothetical protein
MPGHSAVQEVILRKLCLRDVEATDMLGQVPPGLRADSEKPRTVRPSNQRSFEYTKRETREAVGQQ